MTPADGPATDCAEGTETLSAVSVESVARWWS